MSNKFKIYESKGKQLIERLVYPRFVGEITFGQESDIENIQLLDNCTDVSELANAIRAAGEFLQKGHQIKQS